MSKEEIRIQIQELKKQIHNLYQKEKYGSSPDDFTETFQLFEKVAKLEKEYPFADGPDYSSDEIDLYFNEQEEQGQGIEGDYYTITLHNTTQRIGFLRVSLEYVSAYFANIGYHINEKYRGHHYALKALKLVRNPILEKGYPKIRITTYQDNVASIKTIQEFGGKKIDNDSLKEWDTYEVDLRK